MLRMLVRFTHQVAVCLLFSEITHCPPCQLRSDLRPSTALLASVYLLSRFLYGKSWCAGLFCATLSKDRCKQGWITMYQYNFPYIMHLFPFIWHRKRLLQNTCSFSIDIFLRGYYMKISITYHWNCQTWINKCRF